jgi:ribosomal protein S18 acetylase RimI-like enzyme
MVMEGLLVTGLLRHYRPMTASSGVTLRPAVAGDVDVIADIWHRGWRDGHVGHVPDALLPHRQFSDFLRRVPPRIPDTTVATIDGRVVGFVALKGDEVEHFYVALDARGTGVADALMRHAEQVIAGRAEFAWLSVVEGNTRARRFYEKAGWRDTGPFEYHAEIEGGTLPVPCHRYEKRVRAQSSSR